MSPKITSFSFFFPPSEQKLLNLGSTNGIQVSHTWDLERTLLSLQFSPQSIGFHSGEEATARPAACLLLNVLMRVQMQAGHGSAHVESLGVCGHPQLRPACANGDPAHI